MKYRSILPLLFFVCAAAFSQQPVNVNLLTYFDKILPPPSSAKEAYQKCLIRIPGEEDRLAADSIFRPLVDQLEQIQTEISLPPRSPQAEFAEKMKDPEFQKKMEAMSDEEKMKMAMEMNQAMGMTPGPMKREPKSVLKCMEEVGKLSESTAGQMQNLNSNVQKSIQQAQELDRQHTDIDTWEQGEINKLPEQQGGGEAGGGPDPKAVYAVRMKAIKKHLAIVEEQLKKTDKEWAEQLSSSKKLFTPYEESLEKTHFGADAKNKMSKTNISTGQTLMIGSITNLIASSQKAYSDAAGWYGRLVTLQKQNSQ
jgi:hypothetical protein